mmetsp:Transcript_53442/g.134309  ORF Transcript_53442/g.134309 Transcript_53442/m.134309 type:complete len:247 (+) Transcript_53442:545-1285(+)
MRVCGVPEPAQPHPVGRPERQRGGQGLHPGTHQASQVAQENSQEQRPHHCVHGVAQVPDRPDVLDGGCERAAPHAQVHPRAHALLCHVFWAPHPTRHGHCRVPDLVQPRALLPGCCNWRGAGACAELSGGEEAQACGHALQNLQEHGIHQRHVQLNSGGGQIPRRGGAHTQWRPWAGQARAEGAQPRGVLPCVVRGQGAGQRLGVPACVGAGPPAQVLQPGDIPAGTRASRAGAGGGRRRRRGRQR